MDRARTERQRGGVLVAAIAVLAVVGLTVFAVALLRTGERTLGAVTAAPARLAKLDAALAQFVARHRRLPCPARGTLADSSAGAGTETLNSATGQCQPANQLDGVVPWLTLGLTEEDGRDSWNGRISYRVQPSLASNLMRLMDMSWCRPDGATLPASPTGAAQACQPAPCAGAACMHANYYIYGKGLPVRDEAGTWLNQPSPAWSGAPLPAPLASGAAYVLVVHGANGAGAYNGAGVLQGGVAPAGTNEAANANGVALGATVFVDQPPVVTPGTGYFDDVLRHPTLSAVLGQAALGARLH